MSQDAPASMLGRIMAVLDTVAHAPNTSRHDLARATGLPQATCNRIVSRLLAERLLAEGPAGLRLGLRLFELGTQAGQAGVTLLDIAGPYLLDLHRALGWAAQLAVLDGDAVVYLLKIDTRRSRLGTRVAGRFPPHCTGAGKVLLAFSPPEFVDGILDRGTLAARTPATITDRRALLRDVSATRRRGYAVDRGEFQTGMTGVAFPIRPGGRLVGAVTLTGATESFDPQRATPAVRVVAQMIESRLAVQASPPVPPVPRPGRLPRNPVARARGSR